MSRCLTLEEYLEQFVEENTQAAGEEVRLLVTDQQAQTLGLFFINGLAGFVECVRLQRGEGRRASQDEDELQDELNDETDQNEFIN